MREIDLTSVLIAGAIGALLLVLIDQQMSSSGSPPGPTSTIAGIGFAVGAGVQIGVRLVGVS